MKNNIKAEIIAHSKRANTGEEIITYKLTFPRIILSEVNTYKMLEKNTSSSRAIPFEKMAEVVEKDPFIPIAWMLSHKGMQGTKYITNKNHIERKNMFWLIARDEAVYAAKELVNNLYDFVYDDDEKIACTKDIPNTSLSKNYGNRLLEPFTWVTQLITGTRESFEHLFEQRCPFYEVPYFINDPIEEGEKLQMKLGGYSKKEILNSIRENKLDSEVSTWNDLDWLQHNRGQAEIHFMDLAEKMYDALNESEPTLYINSLNDFYDNFWHIPFEEEIKEKFGKDISTEDIIKMSVCLTAKISYTKIGDENTITIEKAREMYERLKNSGHWSCFGHIAKCMTDGEYDTWIKGKCEKSERLNILAVPNEAKGFNKNLRGFVSLRQYIEDKSDFNHE